MLKVLMFDPEKMPSSAGGFPWKADGDFRTVVYIKNETDAARKYTVHLLYQGGQYSLGVNDIKPHQTAAVDFRELRDSQTPDSIGRIPAFKRDLVHRAVVRRHTDPAVRPERRRADPGGVHRPAEPGLT
ncbi:MAG: hypothetical protein IPM25_16665 [Chloracidobacterium sp.]|nr:hypothetical protein [Chloracidobacterium sp.]